MSKPNFSSITPPKEMLDTKRNIPTLLTSEWKNLKAEKVTRSNV